LFKTPQNSEQLRNILHELERLSLIESPTEKSRAVVLQGKVNKAAEQTMGTNAILQRENTEMTVYLEANRTQASKKRHRIQGGKEMSIGAALEEVAAKELKGKQRALVPKRLGKKLFGSPKRLIQSLMIV